MNAVCIVEYALYFSIQFLLHCYAEPIHEIGFHDYIQNEQFRFFNSKILNCLLAIGCIGIAVKHP